MNNETFSEFKNSFSYGYRSDLNFKFLKGFSDEEAAVFIQTLFSKTMVAMDSGDWQPVAQQVIDGQVATYNKPGNFSYDDAPFSPLHKPISALRLGLLTSSGHFVCGDDPRPFGVENMSQLEATARIGDFLREAPTLSTIPMNTPPEQLRVRHGGYDIRSAVRDSNVTFPIDRLREARDDGRVGDLTSTFFSFTGATSHGRLRQQLPDWVERIQEEGVDVMLLVPV